MKFNKTVWDALCIFANNRIVEAGYEVATEPLRLYAADCGGTMVPRIPWPETWDERYVFVPNPEHCV